MPFPRLRGAAGLPLVLAFSRSTREAVPRDHHDSAAEIDGRPAAMKVSPAFVYRTP